MRRRALMTGAAALAAPGIARSQQPLRVRISLATPETHTLTLQVGRFARALTVQSGGDIRAEVFPSARLFRDRDIADALRRGDAEMGVPCLGDLAALEPNVDLFQLPAMYGRTREEVYKVSDGDVGKELDDRLARKTGAHIPGLWLDLGAAHSFTTGRSLNMSDDIKGLRIRTPVGKGQAARVKFLGATPDATAWPDVPAALRGGALDGLLASNEDCVSARLWEAGVRHGAQDHHFLAQCVPMIAAGFWAKVPADQKTFLTSVWGEMLGDFRDDMAKAQAQAVATLKEKGVRVVEPSKPDIEAARKRLMASTHEVVKELGLDAALVAKVDAALAAGGRN